MTTRRPTRPAGRWPARPAARRIPLPGTALLPVALLLTACGGPPPSRPDPGPPPAPSESFSATRGGWTLRGHEQASPVDALLQAVSPVGDGVVWASGHEGSWLRTEDGGETWFAGTGPAGDSLQFRDVEGFDAATAYLLAAGEGAASRIYRTDDGGSSWRLQYRAEDPAAFLDCMAFWDRDTGVVYGDAVDGTIFILRTEDGGETWERIPAGRAPAAQQGEGGFAASGTCAVAGEAGRGWIATGNAARARVLATEDRGRSWEAVDAPVVGGTGAGLATLAAGGGRLVALGGVMGADTARGRYVAVAAEPGRSWEAGGAMAKTGAAYGAAVVPGSDGTVVVAVGPGGMDWSVDGGRSWASADAGTRWAVAFGPSGAGWAVGPGGRIERLEVVRGGGL